MNGTRKKPLQANWEKVINMMIEDISQSQDDDAVSGLTDAVRRAEPAPANLDDAGAHVDVVGNDVIAAVEVPDDVADDERGGDAPEPLWCFCEALPQGEQQDR